MTPTLNFQDFKDFKRPNPKSKVFLGPKAEQEAQKCGGERKKKQEQGEEEAQIQRK